MALPYYIYDLLESESQARWGASNPVGTPITLTYSFPTSEAAPSSYPNYTPFTAVELAATRKALAYIGSFTNISFVETTSSSANLRFGNADLTGIGASTSGYTTYSYNSSGLIYANIFIANTGQASQSASDFAPGSITSNDVGGQGWGTLIHEIGHALGLKHPFETNQAGDPNSVLSSDKDNLANSVMSYTAYNPSNVAVVTNNPGGGYSYSYSSLRPQTYSLYDIAALQYLYGKGPTSAGNKTYTFSPNAAVFETISDRGPNDTIDCSALTGSCTINMTAGKSSNLAISQSLPSGINLPQRYNGTSALTIAYGCAIANCKGGSGNDTIYGNTAANVIDGGAGADSMRGVGGNDSYVIDNAKDIVVETVGNGTDTASTSVSYKLMAGSEVETLQTTNVGGTTALTLTGNEFANSLKGNNGINKLDGGAGNDTIYGYGGNDALTGGSGSDTFVFNTALNASTNIDRITDFTVGTDMIELSHAIFSALGTGALSADAFFAGPAAHDTSDRIIYDGTTGILTYDANGTAAGGATRFAVLSKGLALSAGDFSVA